MHPGCFDLRLLLQLLAQSHKDAEHHTAELERSSSRWTGFSSKISCISKLREFGLKRRLKEVIAFGKEYNY